MDRLILRTKFFWLDSRSANSVYGKPMANFIYHMLNCLFSFGVRKWVFMWSKFSSEQIASVWKSNFSIAKRGRARLTICYGFSMSIHYFFSAIELVSWSMRRYYSDLASLKYWQRPCTIFSPRQVLSVRLSATCIIKFNKPELFALSTDSTRTNKCSRSSHEAILCRKLSGPRQMIRCMMVLRSSS